MASTTPTMARFSHKATGRVDETKNQNKNDMPTQRSVRAGEKRFANQDQFVEGALAGRAFLPNLPDSTKQQLSHTKQNNTL
jgi:hypothetical protein